MDKIKEIKQVEGINRVMNEKANNIAGYIRDGMDNYAFMELRSLQDYINTQSNMIINLLNKMS